MQFTKASVQAKIDAARSRNPTLYDRLMSIAKVASFAECWPVTCSTTRDGYGQIRVNGQKRRTHRVMFSLFYPDVPTTVVRHNCHNPGCINPGHLRPGTQKDNARDRMECGRGGDLRGEKNGRAVLSVEQVLEIRASAEDAPTLAARFGLTRQTIHAVLTRRNWKHI